MKRKTKTVKWIIHQLFLFSLDGSVTEASKANTAGEDAKAAVSVLTGMK